MLRRQIETDCMLENKNNNNKTAKNILSSKVEWVESRVENNIISRISKHDTRVRALDYQL